MNNWIDFSIQIKTSSIANHRKAYRSQFGLVLFNLGVIAINASLFHLSHNWFSMAAIGAVFSNALWSLMFMLDNINDLNCGKRELKYLKKIQQDARMQECVEAYEKAKKSYNDATSELISQGKVPIYAGIAEQPSVVGEVSPEETASPRLVSAGLGLHNCRA